MSNAERRILTPKGIYQVIEQLANADSRIGSFRLGDLWQQDTKIDAHPVVLMEHRSSSIELNTKTNDFNTYEITLYCLDQPRSDRSDILDIKSSTHAILNDLVLNLRDNPTIKQLGVRIPAGEYSFQHHLMKGNDGLAGTSITFTVIAPTLLCYSLLPQNILEAIDSGCQTCTGTALSYTFNCDDLLECPVIQEIQSDIATLFTLTGGTSFDCSSLSGCSIFDNYLPLTGGTITGDLSVVNGSLSLSGVNITRYFLSTGTTFGDGFITMGLDPTEPYIVLNPHIDVHTVNADEVMSISGTNLFQIFTSNIAAGPNISVTGVPSATTVSLLDNINLSSVTANTNVWLPNVPIDETIIKFAVFSGTNNNFAYRTFDPTQYLNINSDSTVLINSNVQFSGSVEIFGGLGFPSAPGKWPVLFLNGASQVSTSPSFYIDQTNNSAFTYNIANIVTQNDIYGKNGYYTTLSASTNVYGRDYFSGETNISRLFLGTGTTRVTSLSAGTNVNLTGTATDPVVNLNNNISVSHISATTYFSGSTPLTTVINQIASQYSGGTSSSEISVKAVFTGSNYDLLDSDKAHILPFSSSTSQTLTIKSATTYTTGMQVLLEQNGTGQLKVTGDTGVTITSYGSAQNLIGRYASAFLTHKGSNVWLLDGNLTTINL